jgi:hypothetical protein
MTTRELSFIGYYRSFQAIVTLLFGLISGTSWVSAQESGNPVVPANDCRAEADESTELDEEINYGPDPCEPRKTLLQWSYGTSFSGGPDLDEPLGTDRPDFTENSATVGRGVVQLESGYTYSFDDDGVTSTESHSYPETLLRIGMFADWFEARVGWNYAQATSAGLDASGSEDLYLGVKFGLTPQEGILPEMALVPQMTVPTGSDEFTADEVLPGVNWLYGWDINDFLSTAGSTQVNRSIDDGSADAYTEWAQSWTFGYTLSEKLGAYTEWYALFPNSADTALPEHYFNGGLTYRINHDVQWDVRAGTGLNDAADDFIAGAGLSIRFR